MKILITIVGLFFASFSYADQLAYISQSEAEKAVEIIKDLKSVYLFCGCCSMKEPRKVSPTKVYTKFTGYESYWEVFIEYTDENGNTVVDALDLAYVWRKKMFGYKTIGNILGLEHDFCVKPKDWNKSKNQEKDI